MLRSPGNPRFALPGGEQANADAGQFGLSAFVQPRGSVADQGDARILPLALCEQPLPHVQSVRQFPEVVEERLVGAGFKVAVPMALVEAAGSNVVAVDVDLEQLAAACPNDLLSGAE